MNLCVLSTMCLWWCHCCGRQRFAPARGTGAGGGFEIFNFDRDTWTFVFCVLFLSGVRLGGGYSRGKVCGIRSEIEVFVAGGEDGLIAKWDREIFRFF